MEERKSEWGQIGKVNGLEEEAGGEKGWTNEKDGRGGNGLCTKVGILLQRKIRF